MSQAFKDLISSFETSGCNLLVRRTIGQGKHGPLGLIGINWGIFSLINLYPINGTFLEAFNEGRP